MNFDLGLEAGFLFLIPFSSSLIVSTTSYKVTVVGGGIGGLVSSAILAQEGIDVTLIEQRELGGRMNSEIIQHSNGNTYRFDTGPSLMLLPDIYKKTFELLNSAKTM